MDKVPVYPAAIPLATDLLQAQRNLEVALGFCMQAAFGVGTIYDGLTVTQTAVPSLQVKVGPGSIITATTVDTLTTGFGSLTVDNSNPLVKMGINLAPTIMGALSAPATTGYSANVLVEAQFLEADGSPVVLPYVNVANPSVPYSGPNNSGAPNNTARTQTVQLQYKYGTAAASGSQVTPSPDAGWIGVAVVTIANGQSTIANANITPYVGATGATMVGTKLPFARQRLTANLNLYVSPTGSDSNSGLGASVPFATMQKAWNTIVNGYDLSGYNVTINLANGTYTTGLAASGAPVGLGSGNAITLLGNATAGAVTISTSGSSAIAANTGAALTISGITIVAAGGASSGVQATTGGSIGIGANITFGACGAAHIAAVNGGIVGVSSSYSVTGASPVHWQASNGTISAVNVTIAFSGTINFSSAFASAVSIGNLQCYGLNYGGGTVTGTRYQVASNSLINTSGGGASYLPGNAAGSSASGGQYV